MVSPNIKTTLKVVAVLPLALASLFIMQSRSSDGEPSRLEKEALVSEFSACFLPGKEGRIRKISPKQAGIFIKGKRFEEEYLKQLISYYKEDLGGGYVQVSNKQVRFIILVTDSFEREASRHHDQIFNHLGFTKEAVNERLEIIREKGGHTAEFHAHQPFYLVAATVLILRDPDPARTAVLIRDAMQTILFPFGGKVTEPHVCPNLLDPENETGKAVAILFNSDEIVPGMTYDDVMPVIKGLLH